MVALLALIEFNSNKIEPIDLWVYLCDEDNVCLDASVSNLANLTKSNALISLSCIDTNQFLYFLVAEGGNIWYILNIVDFVVLNVGIIYFIFEVYHHKSP